ncbi:phage replisome organizer N-terminal domain-containing protein [Melissococcus plutonius]|uniref:phage replisome organizer N-terminal domain-containing protein n=1 Tax=Melissococcus plutonius TaxID=33970 RepID=UPI003C2F4A43
MAEISWIKLKTTMFDDEKIRLIQAIPESDAILIIWIRLLVLAGKTNDDGLIYIQRNMPYTEEMLATLFDKQINTVRLALKTLSEFNMIDLNSDGSIAINNWEKHQNIEGMDKIRTQNRLRKQKQREKQKKLSNVTGQSRDCHAIDKDIDKDIDIDIDKMDNVQTESIQSPKNVAQSKSIEIEKDIEIDKEKEIENKPLKDQPKTKKQTKPIRHQYGEYKNVLLSDKELETLKQEFSTDWEDRIERVSEYCASQGKSYKNYLATIRNWAKRDKKPQQSGYKRQPIRQEILPDWVNNPPEEKKLPQEKKAELDKQIADFLARK